MPIDWMPRQFSQRNLWNELERLRGHLESMYDTVADSVETFRRRGTGVYPAVNLSEDEDNLYLTAEMPGVTSEDVELTIQGESLILKGERRILDAGKEVSYHRREREAGVFRRVVSLPVSIDVDRIQARSQNGILIVILPKAAAAKARKVAIQAE